MRGETMQLFDGLGCVGPYIPYLFMPLASTLAIYGIAVLLGPDERSRRLSGGTVQQGAAGPSVRRSVSAMERLVTKPFASRLAPSDERERSALKLWLLQGGYDSPQAVQAYYGFRVFFVLLLVPLAVIACTLVFPGSAPGAYLSAALGAAVVGFMFP